MVEVAETSGRVPYVKPMHGETCFSCHTPIAESKGIALEGLSSVTGFIVSGKSLPDQTRVHVILVLHQKCAEKLLAPQVLAAARLADLETDSSAD